jgi:hypothetical protein
LTLQLQASLFELTPTAELRFQLQASLFELAPNAELRFQLQASLFELTPNAELRFQLQAPLFEMTPSAELRFSLHFTLHEIRYAFLLGARCPLLFEELKNAVSILVQLHHAWRGLLQLDSLGVLDFNDDVNTLLNDIERLT